MPKRTVALLLSLFFLFSAIVFRLFHLTDSSLSQAADLQSTVTVTIARSRGTIYDCHGQRLTNNEQEYRASVIATPQALAALSEQLPPEEWADLSESLQTQKPVVKRFSSPPPLATGILQFLTPVRYGKGAPAPHTIGYVGEDGHGVCGIEQALDEELVATGGSVTVTYQTDGKGNVLPGGKIDVNDTIGDAKAGIRLTLDRRIQNVVEERGKAALSKGAIVVLEPYTGHILALASFPDFDRNAVADYLDAENSPLFDRTMATYNCGSVFKIVTAAAALESGIPLSRTFICNGSLSVGSNVINCHYRIGHGKEDMTTGFINSCNPYFIQLAQETGGSLIYRMASLLGFDSSLLLTTGYGTARAVLPPEADWQQPTALANLSFGQGSLMATPLHIAQMTATVATGGWLHHATLYAGKVDENGRLLSAEEQPPTRVFSQKTAISLRRMMEQVITEGTGGSAAPAIGTAAGKTGTAQTGWTTASGETMVQNWFTGFYPADDPRFVITVLAEDAGTTGEKAAPVFKTICDDLYRMGT